MGGRIISIGAKGEINIFDASTFKCLSTYNCGLKNIRKSDIDPAGKCFYILSNGNRVYSCNLFSGDSAVKIGRIKNHVLTFSVSLDGNYNFAGTRKREMKVNNISDFKVESNVTVKYRGAITVISYDVSGKKRLTIDPYKSRISQWDISSLNITPIQQTTGGDKNAPQLMVTIPRFISEQFTTAKKEVVVKGVAIDDQGVHNVYVNGSKVILNKYGEFEKAPSISRGFLGDPIFYLLTIALNSAPALNFATFLAAILIVAPVCGLRPSLAALLVTEKVPKPTKVTLSPFFNALLAAPMKASIVLPASALVIPVSDAIASINSALFIIINFKSF